MKTNLLKVGLLIVLGIATVSCGNKKDKISFRLDVPGNVAEQALLQIGENNPQASNQITQGCQQKESVFSIFQKKCTESEKIKPKEINRAFKNELKNIQLTPQTTMLKIGYYEENSVKQRTLLNELMCAGMITYEVEHMKASNAKDGYFVRVALTEAGKQYLVPTPSDDVCEKVNAVEKGQEDIDEQNATIRSIKAYNDSVKKAAETIKMSAKSSKSTTKTTAKAKTNTKESESWKNKLKAVPVLNKERMYKTAKANEEYEIVELYTAEFSLSSAYDITLYEEYGCVVATGKYDIIATYVTPFGKAEGIVEGEKETEEMTLVHCYTVDRGWAWRVK